MSLDQIVDRLGFFVAGKPVTKGSMRAFNNIVVQGGNAKRRSALLAWSRLVRLEATRAAPRLWSPSGPVALAMTFYLPPPKRPEFSTPATNGRNDIDKLARAVLDSLTGVLYKDDGQVTELRAFKRWAGDGGRAGLTDLLPGVVIAARRMS